MRSRGPQNMSRKKGNQQRQGSDQRERERHFLVCVVRIFQKTYDDYGICRSREKDHYLIFSLKTQKTLFSFFFLMGFKAVESLIPSSLLVSNY